MKLQHSLKVGLVSTLIGLGVISGLVVYHLPLSVKAQSMRRTVKKEPAAPPVTEAASTNAPAPAGEPELPGVEPAVAGAGAGETPGLPPVERVVSMPGRSAPAPIVADILSPTNEVQLSFQGANIEMIVQWLAKVTGKSVIKHPKVQCQLTIVSSMKLRPRQAIDLVYRALALEGFTTLESSKAILIVPEGQEPKLSPELMDGSSDLPEGRQRLVKIFPLKNIPATELREKIRTLLSEKASIEIADRANQLIVTDYTENLRLLGDVIKELDVPSSGDTTIEFYPLKHSEAEELATMLSLILSAQAPPPSAPASRPSPSSSRIISSSSSSMRGEIPSPGGGSSEMSSSSPPPPSSSSSSSSGSSAASASGQQIRIWPDKTSNRLVISAPRQKHPEIKQLIETLDVPKPQDVAIRILPLKNASAEDLVREIGPLHQKLSGRSMKDTIEVAANTRANALVILSSEANFKIIESMVARLDTDEAQEKTMRTFTLKNADAEDVAKQMQDLNQDQESGSRYPFFIFSSSYGGKSGKKFNFVADRRRNAVIVQAPPGAMDNIAKLIEALDQPITDNALAPKIYRLKYVSSTDLEEVLNELFLKRSTQRSYWEPYYYSPYGDSSDRQASGGRLAGKVRITSEPYANAIIVTANSTENLAVVEEIIKQLDIPSQAGETTLRLRLRFAKATTLANSINILFAKNGSPPLRQGAAQQPQQGGQNPQQQQYTPPSQSSFELGQEAKEDGYFPWLGGQPDPSYRSLDGRNTVRQVSDLVGRVRVVPDTRSNSLLISANVHLLPQVLKLVEELDIPTAQVLIEAKIVEVSSDFLDKLGVRWSPDGNKTFTADDFDNSILIKANNEYQKQYGDRVQSKDDAEATAALANSLRSGLLTTKISLDFLIQFLRKNTDARVLAEPQINIADNEMGKLFVGSQVPFIDKSLSTDVGGLNQSFTYKDVGIILEVTPHINESGDVALKVRAESSAIEPGQTLFGGAIVDTRNFRTDLTAKNEQTLVLGGIIQRQVSDTLRKVPLLGDIPGLGWAFKKKDKMTREVELMVFLRPKVVRTPEEAKELLEEVDKKAPLIKTWKDGVTPGKEKKSN